VIALSSGSLYTYGLARVFALAAEAGFDGIEVLVDDRWDTRQLDYLRQVSDDYQLPISSLHAPFVPYLPGWPVDPIERLKSTIALAQGLNVKTVVLHLPLRVGFVVVRSFKRRLLLPAFPSPFGKVRRWMENELAAFETSNGLKICVENMPARRILGRCFNFYTWNNTQDWPRFPHLTLDTTHLGTWGLDPLNVYHRTKERVSHVHLSNFNGQEHRRLEDGHLPLADLLRALRDDGYQGAVVVELDPESLDAADETQALAHLKNQVAFCRQHFEG
jgi:sugar phosphate isomerase/epimerase